jgi:hypothetical protein
MIYDPHSYAPVSLRAVVVNCLLRAQAWLSVDLAMTTQWPRAVMRT